MKSYSYENVLELLKAECNREGNQKLWASKHNFSQPYVSDVLQSKRAPGKRLLNALGLKEVTYYEKI